MTFPVGLPRPVRGALAMSLGAQRAASRMAAINELALQAAALAAMDYDFLFDKVRRQLVIGYNVAEGRCDPYTAAERGYLDDVIVPHETRPKLITALHTLQTKREPGPKRKHGNIPL